MDDFELLAWVLRGRQRRSVLHALHGTMIPAQILEKSRQTNPRITRNGISDTLRDFRARGLAICHNPNVRKGRLYSLTALGRQLRSLAGFSGNT